MPGTSTLAGTEAETRARLQRAIDASLQLEVRGRAIADSGQPLDIAEAVLWPGDATEATVLTTDRESRFRTILDVPVQPVPLPAPRLHAIDRAGTHWHGSIDLSHAPASGCFEVGDVVLRREGDDAGGEVVDDGGRPVPGASVMLVDGDRASERRFRTATDAAGRFRFCEALPLRAEPELIITADGFAPLHRAFAARVELQRGSEIHGTVRLRPGIETTDIEVVATLGSHRARRGGTYASLSSPVGPDGAFVMRHVPRGVHWFSVADRMTAETLGDVMEVDVPMSPPPELRIRPDAGRPRRLPLRLRLVDGRGRQPTARGGWLLVSDVGVPRPILDGRIDCSFRSADEPIGLRIPGYEEEERQPRRDGDTVVLRGGHRLAFRLALQCCSSMPLGSVLELSLEPVEYGASILSEEPADDASDGRATTMRVDGDALVTVSRPGEYRMRLVLRTRGKPDCDVPVQPASFTVTGDDERQRIVLEAAFASATAIDPAR